jgi:hypothetical protein
MCSKISFYFNKNDPNFKSTELVAQQSPYIGHWFITCPIYNSSNVQIGYKATDDYVQEVGPNKYLVRYYNTYYFNDKGTISWQYSSVNSQPNPYYPMGITAKGRITSGTENYVKANGMVSLKPKVDGMRNVKIKYKK